MSVTGVHVSPDQRLDVRPRDLELLDCLREMGEQLPPGAELLDGLGAEMEQGSIWGTPVTFRDIDVRRFQPPEDVGSTLQLFGAECGLEAPTRAHEDLVVRRVAILGNWMTKSQTFRGSDGQEFAGLASLLMRCMGVNLQKLGVGEEVCLHLVVPYTQHAQEDYVIFVPSLVQNPLQPDESVCCHGPFCDCNQVRIQLLELVPNKVLVADPIFSTGLLTSAEEDERQGIEALVCAFGIHHNRIREIFAEEGYVLTRDFACKILELLARRRSRVATVLVGESGTGKTRVPWLMRHQITRAEQTGNLLSPTQIAVSALARPLRC